MHGLSGSWARAIQAILVLIVIGGLAGGCAGVSGPLLWPEEGAAEEPTEEQALVRVAACWAALPLVAELASEYSRRNPRTSFDVMSVEADLARDLVATGQADVAVVGADPALGLEAGTGMVARALAIEAVAVVVHPTLGLADLTAGQLAALYAGRHLRWGELGGADEAVEVLVQPPESTERVVFERAIMGDQAVSSIAIVAPHDRAVIEYVAEHPGAIGYVSHAYADERVRVVAVDGCRPTTAEVRSGRYPLGFPLVLVMPNSGAREAERWVAYALSNRGRQVIERRYVALH